jgi:N-formylglutamate deformylase
MRQRAGLELADDHGSVGMFELSKGHLPLLISVPHVGTLLPDEVKPRLTPLGLAVGDTDWYVDRLWSFVSEWGGSILKAKFSRTVIDLNRSAQNEVLYEGQVVTGLCPTYSFDGEPLYQPGQEPTELEMANRIPRYWQPYHQALSDELQRLKTLHGRVLLIDAHSIRSEVPRLFNGRLWDINLGTFDSRSMDRSLEQLLLNTAKQQSAYSVVLNGRFKGGYITRHYGQPTEGIAALQVELSQRNYMDEQTLVFEEPKARELMGVLQNLAHTALSTFGVSI